RRPRGPLEAQCPRRHGRRPQPEAGLAVRPNLRAEGHAVDAPHGRAGRISSGHARLPPLLPHALEDDDREWRQRQDDRVWVAVPGDECGLRTAQVALPAAAVERSVAVEDLTPGAPPRDAEPLVWPGVGGVVAGA